MKYIETPLNEDVVITLKAGDRVMLSGFIYTARDAAHKKLYALLEKNEEPPFPLEGSVLFYVGPTPAPPGKLIGSAGPTTSMRMDPYTPFMLEKGIKGFIGKGARSPEVRQALQEHKGIYFAATGGAGALLAQTIKEVEIIAYPELGPEAIRKLKVENMPLLVIYDAFGGDLYTEGVTRYKTK